MSIIICDECGKEISNKATTCIHCGNPINNKNSIIKSWYDLTDKEQSKLEDEFDKKYSGDENKNINIVSIFIISFCAGLAIGIALLNIFRINIELLGSIMIGAAIFFIWGSSVYGYYKHKKRKNFKSWLITSKKIAM